MSTYTTTINNRTVIHIQHLLLREYDINGVIDLVANWKLGQDKTRLSSHRISRLDKTVLKFLVADSLDLSPIQFTPPTSTSLCLVDVGGVN